MYECVSLEETRIANKPKEIPQNKTNKQKKLQGERKEKLLTDVFTTK